MDNQKAFYDKLSNWDFSMINYHEESLTNWDYYDEIRKSCDSKSKVLDLGTAGGEKLLEYFPDALEIIGTDYSKEMIETANKNLEKSGRKNIKFKVMDNLSMTTEDNYFDIVCARHTCIDAKQIYKTLKPGGKLILRGVDKLDCWRLKMMFQRGQAYKDPLPISLIDYENIINAGFKNVELIPIHVKEYYNTKEDLLALLLKTPILNDFSEMGLEKEENIIDIDIINQYIEENQTTKGILLIRRYYGITASK